MKYFTLLIVLASLSTSEAEERRQTPDYYKKQFNHLYQTRSKYITARNKLNKDLSKFDSSVDLLALKYAQISDLCKITASIESLLEGRPSNTIEQELATDLNSIGRYANLYYAKMRNSSDGAGSEIVSNIQLEYLLLRLDKTLLECRDKRHWDYDFKKLKENIFPEQK